MTCFFFFQAEDGIRDIGVTGVQTCALPICRVGAFESGTLGYFHDDTVNLDGKVNRGALRAARSGTSPDYVDRMRIDVLVDIASGIRRATRGRTEAWRHVSSGRRYHAGVRRGREEACLSPGRGRKSAVSGKGV